MAFIRTMEGRHGTTATNNPPQSYQRPGRLFRRPGWPQLLAHLPQRQQMRLQRRFERRSSGIAASFGSRVAVRTEGNMTKGSRMKFYSVFGEIAYLTVTQMIKEGKGIKLFYPSEKIRDLEMLPPSTRFNELGQMVRCVVIMDRDTNQEWERRIAEARW